ncbi:MAG: HNH endonuclease [Polyangiales bacterium]
MVPLVRGPTPRPLAEHGARWTLAFVAERAANPSKRPLRERYGHPEVRVELRRMSLGKCFYCERKHTDGEQEVDHHIEVAERPDLAFAWENLYLSCRACNGKAPNTQIPVASCVDPCAPSASPNAHLTFHGECIQPRANSSHGRETIEKYRLHRDELDLARARALREFDGAYIAVLRSMNASGRKEPSVEEREFLRDFADPARPFSLMMATYLKRLGL